jgi:hypothetical protein
MTLLHITLTELPWSVIVYLLGVVTGLAIGFGWRRRPLVDRQSGRHYD